MGRRRDFSRHNPALQWWRIGMGQPHLSVRVQLYAATAAVLFATVGLAGEVAKELVPRGTIVDADQEPIPGAQIRLHRWDGVMSPALQTATTDAGGNFEFPPRAEDAYYQVVIRKAPYAPLAQTVHADHPIKATLRAAVDSWIEVRSEEGDALKGARIANISIRTEENPESYVWRGMEHLFGFNFVSSDKTGRLDLPPLPDGALIDVRIDHPRWAQAKVSNVRATAGRLGAAILPEGVLTTFEFVEDPRTPLTLDGLICETLLLSQSSNSAETLNRIPFTIRGDQFKFCAHPVTYNVARMKAAGVAITPVLHSLTISPGGEIKVRFLVRKTVNVSGRVLHRDGAPHQGARVYGQIENLSPDGRVSGSREWIYFGTAETNEDGKYTVALPPGLSRIAVESQGFVADRDETELEVQANGSNEIPDFITDRLEPVRGRVVDESGRAVSGAIVRIRHPWLLVRQPVVSNAEGKFEIVLPGAPIDLDTERRANELTVAAFIADQPLLGIARIDLRNTETLRDLSIVLRPDSSAEELLSMEDNRWFAARKEKAAAEQDRPRYAAGQRGQPAPELDGAAWFNTEARSLKDLRGRYVLLDFWFTGCGPCHADFPSVKLVHEWFEKHGVTVIGVHDNSSVPDAVREHCVQQGLKFPIVVDHTDARILNAYQKLGVRGFPSYILIGPDGKILENDHATDSPSLRIFKLEVIRRHILYRRN